MTATRLTCLLLGLLTAASSWLPATSTASERSQPEKVPVFDGLRVVTVARDLEHPWGLAFLPDGGMLVTERPGRL
ncbi:MAG: PQQ-dependent sugar dehydrogenase, partial [Moraxellaceae bacterium]